MAETLRLRHVALVTDRFDQVVDDVRAVLGLDVCFTHDDMVARWGSELVDEFGIASANFPAGDTFLEVISPRRHDTPAGRYMKARGGEGGYMVILQTDDLERRRARAAELAIREVWQGGVDGLRTSHLHPSDTGGSLMSIDQPAEPNDWPWAGPDWRDAVRTDVTTELVAVDLQAPRPDEVCARWADLLERPMADTDTGPGLLLDRGELRFHHAPGDQEGVAGITVATVDPTDVRKRAAARGMKVDDEGRVLLGGVWFRPEPSARENGNAASRRSAT